MPTCTVSEREVMDLERTYWGLKSGGSGTSGKFDVEAFQKYASPPVPENLCKGVYHSLHVAHVHVHVPHVVLSISSSYIYIVNAMNCSHMLARDAEGREKKNHVCSTCTCICTCMCRSL